MATILVVDDDPTFRELMVETFQQSHTMLQASDGREAIEQLAVATVDLVITDRDMHPMGGIELVEAMRFSVLGHYIPVIMLSGTDTPEAAKEAFRVGVDIFLPKPVPIAILRAVVAGQLMGRR